MDIAEMTEDEVVREFEGLAVLLGLRAYRQWPTRITRDEAVNTARVGVMRAYRTYRPGMGAKFVSYAWNGVRNELADLTRGVVTLKNGGPGLPKKKPGTPTPPPTKRMGNAISEVVAAPPQPDPAEPDPMLKLVYEVAESLPARQREAFDLFYREGLPPSKAYIRLGTRQSNASMLRRNAENSIRKKINELSRLSSYKPHDKGDPTKHNQLTRFTHRNGSFPDYRYVEVGDGERVWGVTHAGERVLTGWDSDDAEWFINREHWLEVK